MQIDQLTLRDFRNYERLELALPDGLSIVEGPVGTGKTNLLEGLFFACTGQSCRTSNERELVRFGERVARAGIVVSAGDRERRFEVALELSPKRVKHVRADGEPVGSMMDLDGRPLVCIFLPDRMDLVKGPAGGRRAHLDAYLSALWPSRRQTRRAYARALAQRNVLIGRLRAGAASAEMLDTWNHELAEAGITLMRDRHEAVAGLEPLFAARAEQLGLPGAASLSYRAKSSADTVEQLAQEMADALDSDVSRGFTTHGPHRDDLRLELGGRELRRFGSQGQQRLGLLSLLLAERDALRQQTGEAPLLLLDDVLSELDASRRESLAQAVVGDGQTLVTTADSAAAEALSELSTQIGVDAGKIAA